MKKLFTLALVAIGISATAQECPKRILCGEPDSFQSSDSMSYDPETKVMVMKKVDFSNDKITICQAETITYDTVSKEMIVENAEKLEFFGTISVQDPKAINNKKLNLRYKIGDEIAYLQ